MNLTQMANKIVVVISGAILLTSLMAPTAFAAASKSPPPQEPLERVIFRNGKWSHEYIPPLHPGDREILIVSYLGSKKIDEGSETAGETEPTEFSLRSDTLLTGIFLPYAYPAAHPQTQNIRVRLQDHRGNIYGPFQMWGQKHSSDEIGYEDKNYKFVTQMLLPEQTKTLLPAGQYTLTTNDPTWHIRNDETGPGGAVMIKGVDFAAWDKYQRKLLLWQIEQAEAGEATAAREAELSVIGNEKLAEFREEPETYVPQETTSAKRRPAAFTLNETAMLHEIVINTYNQGKGGIPGVISITGKGGKVHGQYQAYGALLGKAPNGLSIAAPGIVLAPGEYRLMYSNMADVTYDAQGYPDFYLITSPMLPPVYDFTGRYLIDLDVYRTGTRMGAVNERVSSFSLKEFELSVLDRGDTIELIGEYEKMPFSQVCVVVEREENMLIALLDFSLDMRNLPYKAKVGAKATIRLEKPAGLNPRIIIDGNATYARLEADIFGGDFNTYKVIGKGKLAGKDLPAFVVAALGASVGSVGNIPGPEGPLQAATGMLFPPLAGVVAHVIQEMIRARESARAGARARVRDKAWYAERHPGATSEQLAMIMLADAMANTDNPDEGDAISVGDNEKPGGVDYVEPAGGYADYSGGEEGEDYGYGEEPADVEQEGFSPEDLETAEHFFGSERERLATERDEYMAALKSSMESADPGDPRARELHKSYEEYVDYLDGRINELATTQRAFGSNTMTVQIDHTGRTAEIAYNAASDEWYNTESGTIFDMGRYEEYVRPGFAAESAHIDSQRRKLENRDTAFDREMDALVAEQKGRSQLLGQLQRIRRQSYGIEPPAEGVGDVRANIGRLIDDLSDMESSTEELRNRGGRIAKVVTGRTTGRTMSEDEARKLVERVYDIKGIIAETVVESGTDVITGRTWAGMAGRVALAVGTGGASEYVMSPAEALFDIRESIQAGESGGRATLKAMGKYVLGELGGEYLGEAWKKTGLKFNPKFIRDGAEQSVLDVVRKVGDTPVSTAFKQSREMLFGRGAKGATGQAGESVTSSAGKSLLGTADTTLRKTARDTAEYGAYRTGVMNQAGYVNGRVGTGQQLTPDEIRTVLRDPSVSRELKNSRPDIQNAYQDTLEDQLYRPTNANTSRSLEKDLLPGVQREFGPDAKVKVEVDSVRTPGVRCSRINADNDISGRVTVTDASGKVIATREIPAKDLAPVYNEKFAEAAGMLNKDGSFNLTKAKAEMPEVEWERLTKEQQLETFAKKHNQEVTDVYAAEAAVDFDAARGGGVSNVGQLKAGVSSAQLADPAGLAQMEKFKINNWFDKGGIANQTEAYEQLAKMGNLTNDLTEAYQKLGYRAQDLPSNMQRAIEVAADRSLSPGARTIELQKLGFDGPGDLANKLSGRIEGLQKLGQSAAGAAGKTAGKTLKKVTAAILKAYLQDEN
jgi:hypothetical protein